MNYTITTTKSWGETQRELAYTMEKWGVTEWETNYPKGARLTGFYQSLPDRTVKLTYIKNGKTVVLEMDKQNRAIDNLRVLYLAVEAMRLNEKRMLNEVIESAYLQLAGPEKQQDPYETLQIMRDAPIEVAEAAYKARARLAHPDNGGSAEQMKQLNEAINAIRKQQTQ